MTDGQIDPGTMRLALALKVIPLGPPSDQVRRWLE